MPNYLTTEQAVALGQRRHSVDTYIKFLGRRADKLTAEQRVKLAAILRRAAQHSKREAA